MGVLYASRFPTKVAAYVGVGQVADMAASEAASYAFALEKARERGQRKAIKQLLAIGPPPHTMKALGTQRRWLMAMGGTFGPNLSLVKVIWRGLTSPEASVLDLIRLVRGSSFSLRLLFAELLDANPQRDVRRLETPVFFMLGRLDMQVVAPVSAAYFEVLEAPHKELIWFEASGHMAPFEEPELFNRLMVETVLLKDKRRSEVPRATAKKVPAGGTIIALAFLPRARVAAVSAQKRQLDTARLD